MNVSINDSIFHNLSSHFNCSHKFLYFVTVFYAATVSIDIKKHKLQVKT